MLDHAGCDMCKGIGVIVHYRLGNKKDKVKWTCPRCVGKVGFMFVRTDAGWQFGLHK